MAGTQGRREGWKPSANEEKVFEKIRKSVGKLGLAHAATRPGAGVVTMHFLMPYEVQKPPELPVRPPISGGVKPPRKSGGIISSAEAPKGLRTPSSAELLRMQIEGDYNRELSDAMIARRLFPLEQQKRNAEFLGGIRRAVVAAHSPPLLERAAGVAGKTKPAENAQLGKEDVKVFLSPVGPAGKAPTKLQVEVRFPRVARRR
ncbi:MAG: hypothetical protein WC792_03995 [Candidatus Micrarchaeia archaeon]|jgi:hypothetical protein